MKTIPIEIVELEGKQFVGLPVTCSYTDPSPIGAVQSAFMERRDEILHAANPEKYVCLHFSNEVLFTYIYCMEVSDASKKPEGMITFTLPANTYACIKQPQDEPYSTIQKYIAEHGWELNAGTLSMEVFRFGQAESKYNAEIYVPIRTA